MEDTVALIDAPRAAPFAAHRDHRPPSTPSQRLKPTLLGHSAFALGIALVPHLEGLFQASAWYDGSTSTAMVKEI
jgi:hypothetical protein